ncbi:hypothetical protein Ddc_17698 [Ditylenchus destructor]|nr:hypothetical protein Ddc_17698 [Ditylenchus destructor]
MIFSIFCFVTTIFSATSADETIDVATVQEMCYNFTLLVSAHLPHLDTLLVSCLEVPVDADLLHVSVQFGQTEKFAKHHNMIREHPSKLPFTILVTTTLENEKEAHSIFDIAKAAFNIPHKRHRSYAFVVGPEKRKEKETQTIYDSSGRPAFTPDSQ